ncbi:MAG: cytochrome d ubiquinol oxidase subunit II [Kibdelosporangium sp.]
MEFLWFLTLGLLACGYFALAGYDYGTGVLLRLIGRDESGRRQVLGAIGPFFLGNEVWLVAFAGVLLGVFPALEARLFAGAYPLVVLIVVGVLVFTVATQLRGRVDRGRKAFWDIAGTAGATMAAIGWGLLLGAVLDGLPLAANGYPNGDFGVLLNPGTVLFGVLMFGLFTLHGATFLAVRTVGGLARRAERTARLLVAPCAVAVIAVVANGVISVDVAQPAPALGGAGSMIVLLFAASRMLGRRPGIALACTAALCALPVLIVGTAHLPNVLVSALDGGGALAYADANSSAYTLSQVGWLALPVVPAVLGFQLMTWWAFRRRVTGQTGLFW